MWINFIFSAVVVSFVIGGMARAITFRELTIAKFREKQLKQEKIIALGVASAQVTHDLATPLATIRLLTDELLEDCITSTGETLKDLDREVNRCNANLHAFRKRSVEIKENKKHLNACKSLFKQIEQHCLLNYPKLEVDYQQIDELNAQHQIMIDSSFIPAVLNVINNAVLASKKNNVDKINISHQCKDTQWCITIRDFGQGFSQEHLKLLGNVPLQSEQGLGMAMLLSNASFERLGGELQLSNHREGGAMVHISLPLQSVES
jgi:two-component system sensor histidine kinase RegB